MTALIIDSLAGLAFGMFTWAGVLYLARLSGQVGIVTERAMVALVWLLTATALLATWVLAPYLAGWVGATWQRSGWDWLVLSGSAIVGGLLVELAYQGGRSGYFGATIEPEEGPTLFPIGGAPA